MSLPGFSFLFAAPLVLDSTPTRGSFKAGALKDKKRTSGVRKPMCTLAYQMA
jgi:hypothetical protein